jgi:uncharacterized protein YhaN
MRLRRLDLTRYGHFTDFSLDFGSREEGKPDLHIIFGPNEAGKTTAFEGYLDLLFGIPARSKYNFLHDYENMRVGGALEIDGDQTELVRIKRNKGDLITPSGDVTNPARLLHGLDGVDREQYRAMFSLDDETIEAGGEDILASQGNLGELLFSAAAGLSDLGFVLEAARGKVEQFHKPRARKTELAEAKRELQELHDKIREFDVPASVFRRLKEEQDTAAKLLAAAKETRDDLLSKRARLGAMIECLPLLQTLSETREAMAQYAGYPSMPEGAREEVQDLKVRHVEASTKLLHAKLGLGAEEKARDTLRPDDVVTSIADELTVLLDAPKSRAQTAEEDLPKRETELEGLVVELLGLAKGLGVAASEEGVIPDTRLAQLEETAAKYSDINMKLATAQKEESVARKKRATLKTTPEADAEMPAIAQGLDTLLDDLAPEERLSRHAKATEDEEGADREFKKALESLSPWVGNPSEIGTISLSEAEAGRIDLHWSDLRTQHMTATRDLKDAHVTCDHVAARLQEFAKDDAATVGNDAKNARADRDALWEDHNKSLSPETAEKFHTSMLQDDALQEARLGFAERLARLRELQLEAASSNATLTSCKAELRSTYKRLEDEAESLGEKLASIGLPETYDPRDLSGWQARLSRTNERKSDLDDKKRSLADAARSVEQAVEKLQVALVTSGSTSDLKALTKKARAVVAEAAAIRAQADADKNRQEEAQAEVLRRSEETAGLTGEIEGLLASWEREVSTIPEPLQKIDHFRWQLPTLRKLNAKLAERDKLQRRIVAMKKDRDHFAEEIGKLADRVDEPINPASLVLGERLRRRLERANRTEADLKNLSDKLRGAQAVVLEAEADIVTIGSRVGELAARFESVTNVGSVDDLIEATTQARKAAELRQKSEDLCDRILARLGVSDLVDAEDLLAGQDALELEGQKAAVVADLKAAEAVHEEKVGDLRAARDALEKVGGDNVPARLEERRQTLLLDLEERAREALRLRLGIMAAEQALVTYSDEHKNKMLADTEVAFRTLTAGEYQDLKTQSDGQKEVLLAIRKRDGRSITAGEMSKGTRFQLYLALRLAGYRQYASGGTTLPFVTDDIMETFDNKRTAAALGLLREVASQGQALYFTHHEHVVDLAREVCGSDVTVHDLTRRKFEAVE